MAAAPAESGARDPTWPGLGAVVLAGFGFILLGGLPGVAATVALGGAWYALPAPHAVALGHLLFAVLLPAESGIPGLGPAELGLGLFPAELGLLGLLAAAASSREGTRRFAALLVAGTLLLCGVAAVALRLWGLPAAGLSLAAAALLLGYGLHRYELLSLGLLDSRTAATNDS